MDQIDHHRPWTALRRRTASKRHVRRDIALDIALRRLDPPR
jgi:hypothetical protein